jgi:cytochrome c553
MESPSSARKPVSPTKKGTTSPAQFFWRQIKDQKRNKPKMELKEEIKKELKEQMMVELQNNIAALREEIMTTI